MMIRLPAGRPRRADQQGRFFATDAITDHALDFLIANAALKRDDLAYCGMIGSKTKRATYLSYAREDGLAEDRFGRLTMPVGGSSVADKRPAVIAALVASELIHVFSAVKAGRLPA